MRRSVTVAMTVMLLAGCSDASSPEFLPDSPLFSHVPAGKWTNTGDLSIGRQIVAAAAAADPDGRVFVSGGFGAGPLSLVEAYDPGADVWTEVEPLPGDRFFHASARAGDGLIYAIGGTTRGGTTIGGTTIDNSVVRYDPLDDSWETAASMDVERSGLAAAVVEGKIYVTGGQSLTQVESSGEVYDPGTGEWTAIADMATPRSLHAMAAGSDGLIYAIGGANTTNPFLASVEVYDPARDTWTAAADLPFGRQGLGAARGADGHIYAYGGSAGGGEVESSVLLFDAGAWIEAPSMNQPRFGFAATAGPDGRIYAIVGVNVASGSLSSAEWYLPASTVTVDIDIKPGSDPNAINRKSKGNVPVAVLSSGTFDATTIDRSTVVFAGAPALAIGGGPEDVNGDGVPDVVFHFATQALDLPDGTTAACLSGETTGGTRFEGCDAVRLVK